MLELESIWANIWEGRESCKGSECVGTVKENQTPQVHGGTHEHELEPKDRLEQDSSASNLDDMDVPHV